MSNTLSDTKLETGQEVLCYCTKCKMDLAHTIMSMLKEVPARVICRTCKSEHNFKPKKGVKDPNAAPKKARAPRAKAADKTVSVEVEWTKLINSSTKPLRNYAANEAFTLGDKVAHPSFGEGVVQKLIFPNKVEVVFRMDIKTLIHAPGHTLHA